MVINSGEHVQWLLTVGNMYSGYKQWGTCTVVINSGEHVLVIPCTGYSQHY